MNDSIFSFLATMYVWLPVLGYYTQPNNYYIIQAKD